MLFDATFQKLQNKKKDQEIYLLYFIVFNIFYINWKRFLQKYIYSKVKEWETLDSKYFLSRWWLIQVLSFQFDFSSFHLFIVAIKSMCMAISQVT